MDSTEFKAYLETAGGEELFTGADLKGHVDRAVAAGITTYKENHPQAEIPADVAEATAAKDIEINQLTVDNAVIRECQARGITESFLKDCGITFEAVDQIAPRMEKIGARFEEMRIRKTNEDLANGFEPGGSEVTDKLRLQDISPERAIFLESIGELDSYIVGAG